MILRFGNGNVAAKTGSSENFLSTLWFLFPKLPSKDEIGMSSEIFQGSLQKRNGCVLSDFAGFCSIHSHTVNFLSACSEGHQ